MIWIAVTSGVAQGRRPTPLDAGGFAGLERGPTGIPRAFHGSMAIRRFLAPPSLFGVMAFALGTATACTVPSVQRAAVCEEGTAGCPAGANRADRPSTQRKDGPVGGPLEVADPPGEPGTVTVPPQGDAGVPAADAGPPPKPAACLSPANACFSAQVTCGCAEDCCSGLVCGQIGGLVQTSCCAPEGRECSVSNDCCGQLQCKPDGAGKRTCQPL